MHRPSRRAVASRVALTALAIAWSAASGAGAETLIASPAAPVTPLIDGIGAAGSLAAPATGQTVYIVDEDARTVIGCDPFRPEKRWVAIEPPAGGAGGPAAIACIDSTTLVAACRDADAWTLRTYRPPAPGGEPTASQPRTSHALGQSRRGDTAMIAVGLSRDWLVVTGLADPAPHLRAFSIRGSEPAPLSGRDWPNAARKVVAVAATAGNGLAVFHVDPTQADATASVSLHAAVQPRPLLVLDTHLPQVRAAASSRTSGDLWVLAGAPGSSSTPEGLWRIEAVIRDRRQAVRAVCVARLESPRSLVWISDRMLLVVHGSGPRTLSRVDPSNTRATPGDGP